MILVVNTYKFTNAGHTYRIDFNSSGIFYSVVIRTLDTDAMTVQMYSGKPTEKEAKRLVREHIKQTA